MVLELLRIRAPSKRKWPVNEWFNRLLRKSQFSNGSPSYSALEAQSLIDQCSEDSDWVCLSRHRNGFVREVAVRVLMNKNSSEALGAIVERLNDWVPVIRELAINALEPYLKSPSASNLIQLLGQFVALGRKERADHRSILNRVTEALVKEVAIPETSLAFVHGRGEVARFLFKALWPVMVDCRVEFLSAALSHQDVTIRKLALQASGDLNREESIAVLTLAVRNSNAFIRSRALYAWLPVGTAPACRIATSLMDPSPAVRSVALWAAPRYNVDCKAVFYQRMAGGNPISKAEWLGVLGLAKHIGVVVDEGFISCALQYVAPAVRVAALELPGQSHQSLLAAVMDPSDKVVRVAENMLRKLSWDEIAEFVSSRLEKWHALTERQQFTLLALQPKWRQVGFLLNQLSGAPMDAYWLRKISEWTQCQRGTVDHVTSREDRNRVIERLQQLELSGLISAGSIHRLT